MRNKPLTLGSLFDGSGGFSLGGLLAGVTPVWASEIEPFPIRVTTKRLPSMQHYGDVSVLKGAELPPVDIITFGSPCTDMSVAGKRAGLGGEKSVLFYEAIRIVKEMRCSTDGKYPRYIVWENVPGAFSSNGGEDFRSVLKAVAGIVCEAPAVPMPETGRWPYAGCCMGDGWSLAYRTLDAQYWGVPQRRRRIYLVADLAGGCAREILFESEGVSGYSSQSFRSWQGAAGGAAPCADAPGICLNDRKAATLFAAYGTKWNGNGGAYTGDNFVYDNTVCLNDQGGKRMDISNESVGTLRAAANHPPCVIDAAGFCTEHSAQARSIGYEEGLSPTLRAGVVPATVYENHSQDTRYTELGEVAPTVSSTYGTGGNNQPFVVSMPQTLKIRSGCEGGGKGALIQENLSATISCNNDQTLFEPCAWDGAQISPTLTANNAGGNQRMPDKENFNCVLQAYGISSDKSNAMLSGNPHSGIYEADTARTVDGNGGNPGCNQGGVAVVEAVPFTQNQRNEVRSLGDKSGALNASANTKQQTYVLQGSMIGRKDENGPLGDGINEDVAFTLNTADRHAVYAMTTGEFSQVCEEKSPTLMARDFKDPTVVNEPCYSVRRLTPTECARLQGFPDWWCADLGTSEPSYADIVFWQDVFETHRRITGSAAKPKTQAQIVKWLKDPHSDSAEYKMWGNGVALPCVFFVLAGIVWAENKT